MASPQTDMAIVTLHRARLYLVNTYGDVLRSPKFGADLRDAISLLYWQAYRLSREAGVIENTEVR